MPSWLRTAALVLAAPLAFAARQAAPAQADPAAAPAGVSAAAPAAVPAVPPAAAPDPGDEEITLRWATYDSSDGILDTTGIVDNFKWILNTAAPVVSTTPVQAQ